MFASHHKLDNLVMIVDQNGLQIDGAVEDVAGIGPLDKKFEAFGFEVIGWAELGIAAAIGACVIPVVEIVKLIQRIYARKKAQK